MCHACRRSVRVVSSRRRSPELQAAAALDELSLNTPSKRVKIEAINFDDAKPKKPVVDAKEPEQKVEDAAELRKRWVGEVDLPERQLSFLSTATSWRLHVLAPSDMEPILVESKRRFVLFPIQYHEVCRASFFRASHASLTRRDAPGLANVQEG